jgi:hypothetical protein
MVEISQFRRGVAGLAKSRRADEVGQCEARNWTPPSNRCRLKTHWLCGTCGRMTCGVHATWHAGDFARECATQFRFISKAAD